MAGVEELPDGVVRPGVGAAAAGSGLGNATGVLVELDVGADAVDAACALALRAACKARAAEAARAGADAATRGAEALSAGALAAAVVGVLIAAVPVLALLLVSLLDKLAATLTVADGVFAEMTLVAVARDTS